MTARARYAVSRVAIVLTTLAMTGVATAARGSLVDASEAGIAAALGDAVGGEAVSADVVWEPTRGAVVDALWGRGVAFLARTGPAPDGVARRDAFRARVTVAPGGAPLRVVAVHRLTETALADEHDLMARGDRLAWLTRGTGGEHGATVLLPVATSWLRLALRTMEDAGLPPRDAVHAALDAPSDTLRGELRDDVLVLAIGLDTTAVPATVDPAARTAQVASNEARLTVFAAARRDPAPPLPAGDAVAADTASGLEVASDAIFPPSGPAWTALAAPQVPMPGESPPPAPIARAEVGEGERRVVLHAFDMRQLDLTVVPAPAAPRAVSGLPGTGALAEDDLQRVVAVASFTPLRDGGARTARREIAPLVAGAPTLSATAGGTARIGPLAVGSSAAAIEVADDGSARDVAGWCLSATTLLVATSPGGQRSAVEHALQERSCASIAWVDDAAGAATPRLAGTSLGLRAEPFIAWLRHREFPEGRGDEGWRPSPGRQPAPVFRPAILEAPRDLLGARVRVMAFVGGRMGWALRAGTGERSHRAGGQFPVSLGELRGRAIASLGLGIGQRRRPNGLTIGGSTGHRYASRGAVLLAEAGGIRLLRSSDLRGDPPGDATELAMTVEGGVLTSEARRRGLLQDRSDLCVLPDGTVLAAVARFDSHEASAEALSRLGCTDVVALDRGLDVAATVGRATDAEPLLDLEPTTVLIALDPGSP